MSQSKEWQIKPQILFEAAYRGLLWGSRGDNHHGKYRQDGMQGQSSWTHRLKNILPFYSVFMSVVRRTAEHVRF